MEKFVLNITASSGEFFQGECESLTLPTADGQYGVQAGHSPVLVALEMGIMQFTVNGETRSVLVGDGIAEVTPAYVVLQNTTADYLPAKLPPVLCRGFLRRTGGFVLSCICFLS